MKSIQSECSKPLAFVLFAMWLRFALSAFHQFTHDPIVLGLSINALGSVFIVSLGLLVLPSKAFLFKKFLPLYIFISVVIISGLYNHYYIDLLNVLLKWTYLLVIALAIILSVRIHGLQHSLCVLLKAFYLPVSLLVLSIIFGEVKATESDGSRSYIGGYRHESSFSMVIISFAIILALINKQVMKYRTFYFYAAVVLLYFVNYRTAIITILPIILLFVFAGANNKIPQKYRLVSFSTIAVFIVSVLYVASLGMSARFADIGTLLANWDTLLKAPEYYTNSERQIFSSRVYLWSQYITEFSQASRLHQIIGFGPESWKHVFRLYAHNTYVSYLYEYGIAGIIAFIAFIISVFVQAFKINNIDLRLKLIGGFLGFLTMNLATMPIWNLEGLITMAIIIACVLNGKDSKQNKPVLSSTILYGK